MLDRIVDTLKRLNVRCKLKNVFSCQKWTACVCACACVCVCVGVCVCVCGCVGVCVCV